MAQYKKRHIEEKLKKLSQFSKIMLVTGARQVGKSTLLKEAFPSLFSTTFDPHLDVLGAKADPEMFLKDHPAPIILDEIQYVPQLLSCIKRIVDTSPVCPQYFMTGSQNLSMLNTVSESLAGRVTILELGPLTLYEQLECTDQPLWLTRYLADPGNIRSYVTGLLTTTSPMQFLWRGGMPVFLPTPDEFLHDACTSYLKTYIQHDVRNLGALENIQEFTNFFGIMAALTAQEINYNQLGRELNIAGPTAKKWLSLLKYSYQWRDIPPYHGNTIKRITQKPKGYITDTGFACFLQGVSSPETLRNHPLRGALFETLIVNTIDTLLSTMPFKARLYHWRSTGGAEVDLIIALDNKLYPIEIKMQSHVNKYDARGIQAFHETYRNSGVDVMPGLIIYSGNECYRVTENVTALPWNCSVQ